MISNPSPRIDVGLEIDLPASPPAIGLFYETDDTHKLFVSIPGLMPGTVVWQQVTGGGGGSGDAFGKATVFTSRVTATSRFVLGYQPPAGVPPTGILYPSTVIPLTSFIITSTGASAGQDVYWQLNEPG